MATYMICRRSARGGLTIQHDRTFTSIGDAMRHLQHERKVATTLHEDPDRYAVTDGKRLIEATP